jgi:hypothetical protein
VSWQTDDRWDPGNPENRQRTRLLQGQLREVLLAWDPIGVAGSPEAGTEYDSLMSPLMHQLHQGADAKAIAAWLMNEMRDRWRLSPDPAREVRLAGDLVNWWANATGGDS